MSFYLFFVHFTFFVFLIFRGLLADTQKEQSKKNYTKSDLDNISQTLAVVFIKFWYQQYTNNISSLVLSDLMIKI